MKIFRFVQKVFFLGLTILSNFTNVLSATPLDCISMKNQECKIRPEIININSNNLIFYPFSIKINKCSGNCNNINNPYAKICITDIIKNLNVNLFNLISRTNETRFIDGMKNVSVNVDQMQLFLIINKDGIKINVDMNVKN